MRDWKEDDIAHAVYDILKVIGFDYEQSKRILYRVLNWIYDDEQAKSK